MSRSRIPRRNGLKISGGRKLGGRERSAVAKWSKKSFAVGRCGRGLLFGGMAAKAVFLKKWGETKVE